VGCIKLSGDVPVANGTEGCSKHLDPIASGTVFTGCIEQKAREGYFTESVVIGCFGLMLSLWVNEGYHYH